MTAQQTFRNTLVVLITLVAAYAVFLSVRIMVVVLVAIIIASAIRPLVVWMHERNIPEGLAILLIYAALFTGLLLLAVAVIPPVASQLSRYIENDQNLANRIVAAQAWIERVVEERTTTDIELLNPDELRSTVVNLTNQVRRAAPDLLRELTNLAGDIILVVVMGVYWLTSRDRAVSFSLEMFSLGRRSTVEQIITEIETSMGAYVRGIIMVCTFVGVANYILLSLFGVPNAVTLAFIIGATTALPVIGGYLGGGAAVLLAILTQPIHGVLTFVSFALVQQVETHYLTPHVMARSTSLNPILVIVFVFIGLSLGGIIGAMIAVPVMGTVFILIRYLIIEPRKGEVKLVTVDGGVLLPGTEIKNETLIVT